VRIRSYVVETPVEERVTLREERVAVERRPVDRAVGDAEQAFQERTIEAEERGEEAVVSKETRVKEEVVVRKEADQRTETVSDTVRSTEVDVEDDRGGRIRGTNTTDRT
jgi:stress response protein YsnF